MQQMEAEIVSVFLWSKLKAFICHNLKALCIRKEIKPLIKAFHRGITLHSIWTYDKVRGLLIIKLCPPDSEQNGHQAKMTTEISTQNLYNPKSYNVLSHVKFSWRHFFLKINTMYTDPDPAPEEFLVCHSMIWTTCHPLFHKASNVMECYGDG